MTNKGEQKMNQFYFLGTVKQKLPKEVWSYKLNMFVQEGTSEYNRITKQRG